MNKKIFVILTLLIVAASVTAVSAFDLGDIFGVGGSESENVTIGGLDFAVPSGYQKDTSNATNEIVSDLEDMGYYVDGETYLKGPTQVTIVVANYTLTGVKTSLSSLGNATTINNVEGYSYWDDGTYIFVYDKDNCMVTFATNDENAIGDFLLA